MSPMDSNVPIPVVVVRGTSPTSLNTQLPRSDPFGNVTHNDLRSGSSSGLFQGWNAYCFTDTQQRDQEDGDDSMASGSPPPSSFDPSSPGNLDFGGRSGLSAMSDMRLRDESTSPMPGLLTPVGEESDVIADLPDQPAGIFEMELLDYEAMTYPWPNSPFSSDTVPTAPISMSPLMVTGRRHTDPSYGDYSTVLLEAPLHGHTTILRRNSSKRRRQREASSCGCALPDRPKISQRIILDKMPTEILIKILRYTIEWAPPASLPRCPHQHTLFRRATAGDVSSSRNRGLSSSSSSSTSAPHPVFSPHQASAQPSVPSENPDEVRKFGINTLLDLLKTCKIFNEILLNEDPWTDETFWKVAARRCWKVLPETLEEIQGQEHTSCNWRIIAGIFMRSENGQFGTPGGGKGGVDCFGGNKACIQASSWETERAGREAIETEAPRNLKMVCAQPGPDAFTVTPDENTRSWTVSLCLRNGEEYIAHLDKCGRFGRAGRLPEGLKRSGNVGCFEPGIFEDIKDRSRLVKVEAIKSLESTEVPNRSQISSFQELQHWDISCVRKCVADEKAHVARCASHKGLLLCNLFTHRDPTAELDSLVDPPEDSRLFCIQSTGKEPEKSVFRWQREFVYADPTAYANARHLHYVICNIRMNQRAAVALVRWNESTPKSTRLLFDREFYVMAPSTGEIIRVLRFPNLFWDFRHHDMDVKYTQLRVDKLNDLYNPSPTESMGAGNRCTRIHEDAFFLTDKHIISGSHDYCNWVWSLDKPDPEIKGVYTAEHQNGGTESDPFDVLDDFYWNSESDAPVDWVPGSERAGWWVKTPNQVLCFWHGVAMSSEQNVFAVCRPGKMFVWDLDSGNNVRGYTCLVPESGERQRWMGKLRTAGERLKGWYTCEGVMPEQGLWLLYEDGESVYIGRDELLKACGIEGTDWGWSRADFVFEKDMVDRGDMAPEQEEDSGERESEDEDWAGSPKGCAKRQRIEEA